MQNCQSLYSRCFFNMFLVYDLVFWNRPMSRSSLLSLSQPGPWKGGGQPHRGAWNVAWKAHSSAWGIAEIGWVARQRGGGLQGTDKCLFAIQLWVVYCFHSWNTFYYSILLQFYTILLLFSDSNYDALKQFIFWATPSLGLTFASQRAVRHSAWIDAFDMACHHKPRMGAIQSKVQIPVKDPACRSPHQAKENEMRNAVLIEKQRREQYQRMATGLQKLVCC